MYWFRKMVATVKEKGILNGLDDPNEPDHKSQVDSKHFLGVDPRTLKEEELRTKYLDFYERRFG